MIPSMRCMVAKVLGYVLLGMVYNWVATSILVSKTYKSAKSAYKISQVTPAYAIKHSLVQSLYGNT
jgi:hypothetical protein